MNVSSHRARIDAILPSAKSIYVSGFTAEILDAPELLREHRPAEATVTGLFNSVLNRQSYAEPEIGLRMRTFFLTAAAKQHMSAGVVDYCPWRYGRIDEWLAMPGRFDTALVMLSPPDELGRCSFGVQADFLPRFVEQIERVVGFINPQMPRTAGEALVDYRSLAAVVDYDRSLIDAPSREADSAASQIAEAIAALIPDGATVQVGVGQIPSELIAQLVNHRGLRIHSGVIDDNVLALEDGGALDRDRPIVTGTAVGTAVLYRRISDQRRFQLRSVSYTHAYRTIVALKRFIAVNSVLQVDLLGQASAEGSADRLLASPGGLPDFARAALDSAGGKSIIAVRARAAGGRFRGIVPLLEPPHTATNPAADADIMVTEFGVASIRDLSLDARAEAIIGIAAPEDQEHLSREWARIRDRLFGRS